MTKIKIVPRDSEIRILPAVVYDTLEFAALVFGGIGELQDFEDKDPDDMDHANDDTNCPLCVHGLAIAANSRARQLDRRTDTNPITKALAVIELGRLTNDDGVKQIMQQRGVDPIHHEGFARVSWDDYRTYFNLVRGT